MDWKGIRVMVKLSVINRVVSIFIYLFLLLMIIVLFIIIFLFFKLIIYCYFQATPTIIPTASALILRELKEPPRDRKKQKNVKHNGNLTLDQVISISRTMRAKSMAKKLEGTVKEILGSCHSIGCTVNGKSPTEVHAEINAGTLTIPEE